MGVTLERLRGLAQSLDMGRLLRVGLPRFPWRDGRVVHYLGEEAEGRTNGLDEVNVRRQSNRAGVGEEGATSKTATKRTTLVLWEFTSHNVASAQNAGVSA